MLDSPMTADAVVVVRPRMSVGDVARGIGRGMFHEGKAYDFDFDFARSDRLVCTEVVYRAYEGIGDVKFELTRRAGRMTLAAEDLLRMAMGGEGFEVVGVYAPEYRKKLVEGGEAVGVLRETLGG